MHLEDLEILDSSKTVQKDTKEEKKWCVYMHTNKINGKRYIGITCQDPEDRWRNGLGYRNSIVFWRAINKYTWDGFDHIIIADGLTEIEAKQKEVELIALYRTNCCRYKSPEMGYNMTDGGEGTTGIEWSEESRLKLSESRKKLYLSDNPPVMNIPHYEGKNHPMFGRHHTEEAKKKISDANKGRFVGEKSYLFGTKRSEEIKRKESESKKGKTLSEEQKKSMRDKREPLQPLYCIELDEYFKNSYDAERKYSISSSTIYECANGKYGRKSAGKHPITGEKLHWKKVPVEEYKEHIKINNERN